MDNGMNATEVRKAFEAAGFIYSEQSGNNDLQVHFDSADLKIQGYVDSIDGKSWQVIALGYSWAVGNPCTTPEELTLVFEHWASLLEQAKREQGFLTQ